MLMITRRLGERIVIGDDIEIIVAEIHRRTVRIGVRGAVGKLVLRGEVFDAIEAANRNAAEAAFDLEDDNEPIEAVEVAATPVVVSRGRQGSHLPQRQNPDTPAEPTVSDAGATP